MGLTIGFYMNCCKYFCAQMDVKFLNSLYLSVGWIDNIVHYNPVATPSRLGSAPPKRLPSLLR